MNHVLSWEGIHSIVEALKRNQKGFVQQMLRGFESLVFISEGGFPSPTPRKKQDILETPAITAQEARLLGHSSHHSIPGAPINPSSGPFWSRKFYQEESEFLEMGGQLTLVWVQAALGGAGQCTFSGEGSAVGSGLGMCPWVSHPPDG